MFINIFKTVFQSPRLPLVPLSLLVQLIVIVSVFVIVFVISSVK
jgi:hypothetical protein